MASATRLHRHGHVDGVVYQEVVGVLDQGAGWCCEIGFDQEGCPRRTTDDTRGVPFWIP